VSSNPTVPYVSFSQMSQQVWWYPVVRGAIAVVLGVIVMINPAASVIFLVRLLGAFLIVDGIVTLVDALRRRRADGSDSGWRVTGGAVTVVVGVVLLVWPSATLGVLAIILGAWAVVAGVLATLGALSLRTVPGAGWGWGLLWGLVTLAFGLALIFSPRSSISVIAWVIGLYAVLSGIVLVVLGFGIRSVGKRAAEIGD
jgi:uncharacterized membrane protein HdeD (DUF308 family)